MGATTSAAPSGGDASAFCKQLSTAVDHTSGFSAAIGTPQQAAQLAQIESDNAAIVASAPGEIHDAVSQVYAISELSVKALASKNPADRAAAVKSSTDAMKSAKFKAAIAAYKAWVTGHCGSLATKILTAGV